MRFIAVIVSTFLGLLVIVLLVFAVIGAVTGIELLTERAIKKAKKRIFQSEVAGPVEYEVDYVPRNETDTTLFYLSHVGSVCFFEENRKYPETILLYVKKDDRTMLQFAIEMFGESYKIFNDSAVFRLNANEKKIPLDLFMADCRREMREAMRFALDRWFTPREFADYVKLVILRVMIRYSGVYKKFRRLYSGTIHYEAFTQFLPLLRDVAIENFEGSLSGSDPYREFEKIDFYRFIRSLLHAIEMDEEIEETVHPVFQRELGIIRRCILAVCLNDEQKLSELLRFYSKRTHVLAVYLYFVLANESVFQRSLDSLFDSLRSL
ncbi:hypothetical protein AS159_05265 [Thermotoga sp. Ku-13t]|uniref:hypothetical protein n=1 Tax=Thermotoga sp. Ku-13t TaxID=1755813 RepID=UPI0013EB4050|nr:hypothetical protein [Thermotoga sp. Ku-13t]KAF2957816.1 hypothetical protein AS159_05265 [Thermotoga sp. Ku-13t]